MLTLVPSSRFVFKVEAEPMNIWSPRVDPEAGDMAILPSQPSLAMQVGLDKKGWKVYKLATVGCKLLMMSHHE